MDDIQSNPLFFAVAALAILLEAAWRLSRGLGYDGRAALTTLGLTAGNIVLRSVQLLLLVTVYQWIWDQSPHRLLASAWESWVIGFFAVEFTYYWYHRASHKIRWLWATHSVHHSATQITFLSSLRVGWTTILSLGWVAELPLIALGLDPVVVGVWLAVNINYQFFIHCESIGRLGPLEWFLNTPRRHCAHHAINPRYIDRNFGGITILYDWMFGTLAPDHDEPRRFGLVGRPVEANPVKLVFREWIAMARDARAAGSMGGAIRALLVMPRHHG